MGNIYKLSADWKGSNEPPIQDRVPSVSLVGEMNGPFIRNNKERLQVQYNAQCLESMRLSKLNKYDVNYAIKSQPFYCP